MRNVLPVLFGLLISSPVLAQLGSASVAEPISVDIKPIVVSSLELVDAEPVVMMDNRAMSTPKVSMLSIKSNRLWMVLASADGNISLASTHERVPVHMLGIQPEHGEYLPLSLQHQPIGLSESASSGDRIRKIRFKYKTNPNWDYGEGAYNVRVVFTVTTQ